MIIDFHTHTFPDKIATRAISGMQANSHASAFLKVLFPRCMRL